MSSTGNSNNDTRKGLTNSLQTLDKESVDFPGSIRYYINNEGALMPRPSRKDTQKMATIYLATAADMTLAFSNIGTAFQFIQDSHADLNPEGSALMLAGAPATMKAVKSSLRRDLDFTVSGADAASQVAAAQSKLDGAIAACALVGVDPANVAKVQELRAAVDSAQLLAADASADSVELSIRAMVLHKRGYNK
jgi:hypothetical protein